MSGTQSSGWVRCHMHPRERVLNWLSGFGNRVTGVYVILFMTSTFITFYPVKQLRSVPITSALVFYEHLITLDAEICLFWKGRKRFLTLLVLWIRYISLVKVSILLAMCIASLVCIPFKPYFHVGASTRLFVSYSAGLWFSVSGTIGAYLVPSSLGSPVFKYWMGFFAILPVVI